MILTLGDLIADLGLRIADFPVRAQDLKRVNYLQLGPGGAANVAIMVARFGRPVGCLGEVGDDPFGALLLAGLRREGIDVTAVYTAPQSRTPVAGVLVDDAGEPAYLGYPGRLTLTALPDAWRSSLHAIDAVFADGWVETTAGPAIILDGLRAARAGGAATFFDPGPGNPHFDNGWHREAAALATAVLANEAEAARLTGETDPATAAAALLAMGAELAVVKRGANGVLMRTADGLVEAPGLNVPARDATGAGDSLAGATIYGWLRHLPLPDLAQLANATGAAKVQKLGTGHNLPTLGEIAAVLADSGGDPGLLPARR